MIDGLSTSIKDSDFLLINQQIGYDLNFLGWIDNWGCHNFPTKRTFSFRLLSIHDTSNTKATKFMIALKFGRSQHYIETYAADVIICHSLHLLNLVIHLFIL